MAVALLSLTVMAQTTIRVEAPNLVASDEQFNVTFVVEGENSPTEFNWDAGNDFQLVWGPQRGSSTSVSIVNGKRTKSSQSTFTYILLPKKNGKFQLPPATAKVKGETVTSQPKTIEVVSGGSASQGTRQSGGSQSGGAAASGAATGDISSSDLFLRMSLSRTSVVVGEPITATLKLYQRVNVAGFEDAKFPTFNGFWSQEVLAPTNIEFHRENINDNLYNAAVLRSWVLIPQQAGAVTIDPAELVCLVNIRTQSAPRSIFDSFFEDDIRTIRKRIVSDRYTVKVSPLPAGAPSSFGGGVGAFSISARLSKDSLKTHDAASLLVTVSGKGNVSLLDAPKINFPPDFECYDVKTTENTDKSNGRISGSKTFEYPFIPRSYGEFTIEPVQYSYYDVNSHKYVTLSTAPMTLKVEKGAEIGTSAGGQIVQTVRGKDVKDLGSDIRYIRTRTPDFSKKGSFLMGSVMFWLILALLSASGISIYFALRYSARRKADVIGSRNRGATKMARRKLAKAGEYLAANQHAEFYEELHRALIGFISDKLNIDMADMSKENVDATLQANGVPAAMSKGFVDLLDACEFARYSPDPGHEAMDAHYQSALNVISDIDSNMKKKVPYGKGTTAILALCLLVPGMLHAAESYPDSVWNAGVAAYAEGRWSEAVSAWQSLDDMGLEAEDLYYNLGNAYFKDGDIAHAILYYERTLKLDPSDADASFNLQYANEFVQDKIDSVPEFFLKTWHRRICWLLPSDTWAVIFFIFFALTVACLLLFLLAGSSTTGRRVGFYAGLVSLVLASLTFSYSHKQWRDALAADSAIIVRPVTSVKSSPSSDTSKDLFVLHEGTKVRLMDTVGEWNNISLSDGRQGWILSSDIEII